MAKLKILIILFIFSSIGMGLFGQSGSSYTRIGIGDIEYSYSPRLLGMGQLGVSVADPDFISAFNPAGLYRLSRTRIETSINYYGMFLNNGTNDSYNGDGEFNGFSIAFPISMQHGIAAAMGVVPYSNISYKVLGDISNSQISERYDMYMEGKGGLSKIFLGGSFKLPFDLVLGAYIDYYFGNLKYLSRTQFENTQIINAEYERIYSPSGVGTTIGMISPDLSSVFGSENLSNFRFGASASIIPDMNTDTIFIATSTLGEDTIATAKGTMSIPLRITAGMSFVLDNNYLFTLDYASQAWSDYELLGRKSPYLRNAMKLSAGFEFRPTRQPGATFWELIMWRAGFSFEQTQIIINDVGLDQVSFAGGFSLPISLENTLDIGLQYSLRGKAESGLYTENVLKLGVGLSLGELWFIRQEK